MSATATMPPIAIRRRRSPFARKLFPYLLVLPAVVYLLSLFAVFGTVPAVTLGESSAPYSTAADAMVGNAPDRDRTYLRVPKIIE